jgi:hypothetical protein
MPMASEPPYQSGLSRLLRPPAQQCGARSMPSAQLSWAADSRRA